MAIVENTGICYLPPCIHIPLTVRTYSLLSTLTSNRFREHKQSKCLIQVHHLLWNLRDNAAPTYFKMVDLSVSGSSLFLWYFGHPISAFMCISYPLAYPISFCTNQTVLGPSV
ncbi:hypothetical protein C5S53_06985 [Methanophagales archaeon]|nr:hypothetical protein C5S53_06985 [Methanophagales archaeon]